MTPLLTLLRRRGVRLVTLTGPGGVGKTRLALQAADLVSNEFKDGVWFVPLAAVRDPSLVVPTIARHIGVRESGERAAIDALASELGGKHLLVLDNCEQILAAAPEIAALLSACPDATVLATSRTVLRLTGEWRIPVPPMTLPPAHEHSPETLQKFEAVRLFTLRAQAADPAFGLDADTAADVAAICRRLDGLPLALELAAARLRQMSVSQLTTRLEHRLPLLTGGPRDQPARLQTMRDAIGWSYELLEPSHQALMRRLAVFNGGFTLDAALAISGVASEQELLDALGDLVDNSILRYESFPRGKRYSMLETVREFGFEQFAAKGEADRAHRAFAEWCLSLVDQAWPTFETRVGQGPWLDRLAEEHDNVRSALNWLITIGDTGAAVKLAGAMYWFWFVRGHLREGRRWLRQALNLPGQQLVAPVDRARALLGAGVLSHFLGEDAIATPWVDEALELSEQAGFGFGHVAAAITRGIMAEDRGDYDEAVLLQQKAIGVARRLGDRPNEALALYHLGVATLGLGRADEAESALESSLQIHREIGDLWGAANALGRIGLLLATRGDRAGASARLYESLVLRRELGAAEDMAGALANIAVLASASREHLLAARLFGAEQALRDRLGSPRLLPERAVVERAEAESTSQLGTDRYAAAAADGRARSLDDMIDLALAHLPPSEAKAARAQESENRLTMLTRREREVLGLVVEGRTNPEIAKLLFISPATVRVHVSNVLAKLGASTRTQAADLARRRGMV